MRTLFRLFFSSAAISGLVACGGGSSSAIISTTSPTSSTTTSVVTPTPTTTTPVTSATFAFPLSGITFTLASGDSVSVPPGTIVQTASGTATINGSNGILYTGSGATITVPANPSGAATNLISTAVPTSGAAYLGPALISPLLGSDTTVSPPTDGQGGAAVLAGDGRLVADVYGNIYSSDAGALKSVKASGLLSTLAANNSPFNWQAIAADAAGNVYGQGPSIAPPAGQSALSIQARQQNGLLITVAENWISTTSPGTNWGTTGITSDSAGVIYAIDPIHQRIVRFLSGIPRVLAGSGRQGFADGAGTTASFNNPNDLVVDGKGNVYVADTGNNAIRKITSTGLVTTVTLTGNPGPITIDGNGNVYCLASAPATLVRVSADLGLITSTVLTGLTGTPSGLTVVPDGTVFVAARNNSGGAQIYRVTK